MIRIENKATTVCKLKATSQPQRQFGADAWNKLFCISDALPKEVLSFLPNVNCMNMSEGYL